MGTSDQVVRVVESHYGGCYGNYQTGSEGC